jgi:hypothetical protein
LERFAAERFYSLAGFLETVSTSLDRQEKNDPDAALGYERKLRLTNDLTVTQNECLSLALVHSSGAIEEFKEQLSWKNKKWTASEARAQFQSISKSIRREMERTLFLYVPQERARYYIEPLKDWEVITKRFLKSIADIEEGLKCFALDRYGGAVFHLMLVAERGAIEVGHLIGINDPKIGWRSVRIALERILQRTEYKKLLPLEQEHFAFLEQLFPEMLSIEKAWRDKISHVENRVVLLSGDFQAYIVEEIISATRAGLPP